MGIGSCIKKIDRHLAKDNVQPLIVDVQNVKDLSGLTTHYKVRGNTFVAASDYCNIDEYPRIDTLFDVLSRKKGNFFVTGLSPFLELSGETELRNKLKEILGMTTAGHVVVFTYQCGRYLNFPDLRLSARICVVEGPTDRVPALIFSAPGLMLTDKARSVKGIHSIGDAVELLSDETLYVETAKDRDAFPHSIYPIIDLRRAYDALMQKDSATKGLRQDYGTYDQWNYALEKIKEKTGWAELIDSEFGNRNTLDLIIPSLSTFDDNKKWLFFIGLKLYGAPNNWCLNEAAQKAVSLSDVVHQAYRCLLSVQVADKDFDKFYTSRKRLLDQLENPIDETIDFCQIVTSKGKDSIWYLTDNTQKEKELIFSLLDKYGDVYTIDEILRILKTVYPALYEYLSPFRFSNELLDKYFQDYKYQKVINRVLPEFESIVTEQAEKRDYNFILPPRTSITEAIDRSGAQLYFVDALGAEYLSYIMSVCRELKLMAKVSVCACELPSITSKNKEFVDLFSGSEHPVVSVKDIDDIKHHGKYNFDYQQTKVPIHLAKELDVIRYLLEKIKGSLADGTIRKAIIISDHGASRLAVIHETESVWEMPSKGVHSGRCCLKSEVDEQPAYATEAGEFWALANYDRFKGGRKANVEVHGGATLEEVTVPIIELTYLAGAVEIHLLPIDAESAVIDQTPEIEISYRKKAAIKIFSTVKLQNVSIKTDGRFYDAVPIDRNFYSVEMQDIKKAKTYLIDVYTCGNLIAEGLPLVVKKEGSREKELL